jgi:hypothetical protein
MEGNLLQTITAGVGLAFIFGVCIWSLISTSRAKKRRIAKEQAAKPKAGEGT